MSVASQAEDEELPPSENENDSELVHELVHLSRSDGGPDILGESLALEQGENWLRLLSSVEGNMILEDTQQTSFSGLFPSVISISGSEFPSDDCHICIDVDAGNATVKNMRYKRVSEEDLEGLVVCLSRRAGRNIFGDDGRAQELPPRQMRVLLPGDQIMVRRIGEDHDDFGLILEYKKSHNRDVPPSTLLSLSRHVEEQTGVTSSAEAADAASVTMKDEDPSMEVDSEGRKEEGLSPNLAKAANLDSDEELISADEMNSDLDLEETQPLPSSVEIDDLAETQPLPTSNINSLASNAIGTSSSHDNMSTRDKTDGTHDLPKTNTVRPATTGPIVNDTTIPGTEAETKGTQGFNNKTNKTEEGERSESENLIDEDDPEATQIFPIATETKRIDVADTNEEKGERSDDENFIDEDGPEAAQGFPISTGLTTQPSDEKEDVDSDEETTLDGEENKEKQSKTDRGQSPSPDFPPTKGAFKTEDTTRTSRVDVLTEVGPPVERIDDNTGVEQICDTPSKTRIHTDITSPPLLDSPQTGHVVDSVRVRLSENGEKPVKDNEPEDKLVEQQEENPDEAPAPIVPSTEAEEPTSTTEAAQSDSSITEIAVPAADDAASEASFVTDPPEDDETAQKDLENEENPQANLVYEKKDNASPTTENSTKAKVYPSELIDTESETKDKHLAGDAREEGMSKPGTTSNLVSDFADEANVTVDPSPGDSSVAAGITTTKPKSSKNSATKNSSMSVNGIPNTSEEMASTELMNVSPAAQNGQQVKNAEPTSPSQKTPTSQDQEEQKIASPVSTRGARKRAAPTPTIDSSMKRKKLDFSGECQIRVLMTGVVVTPRHKKMIRAIRGDFIENVNDSATATHVIAGDDETSLRRTPKLMIGICQTSNIVHVNWLIQSAKARMALPCNDYLLLNDREAEKKFGFSMRKTLRRGDELRQKGESLLGGYSVYICKGVAGNKAPPEEELRLIVEGAGGTWLSTLTVSSKKDAKSTLLITSDPPDKKQLRASDVANAVKQGARHFTTGWLFDGIIAQEMSGLRRK